MTTLPPDVWDEWLRQVAEMENIPATLVHTPKLETLREKMLKRDVTEKVTDENP